MRAGGDRPGVEAALRDKILADVTRGALPADTDAETLAAHVTAVTQGFPTLARDAARHRGWHCLVAR